MFRGEKCYTQHLQPGSHGKNTVCEAITYCTHVYSLLSDEQVTSTNRKIAAARHLIPGLKYRNFIQRQKKMIEVQTEYVLNPRKIFKRIFVIAHAGGLYDTQFILHHIMTKTDLKPELITQGTKLLLLPVENVKFISPLIIFRCHCLNYLKLLGLGSRKGTFTTVSIKKRIEIMWDLYRLWNTTTPTTSSTYTPILDDSKDECQKLIDWHTKLSKQQYVFDFQKEIVDYCISDVNVLQQACLKFSQIMLKEGNVDPFTEAITLPGACNKIFRRNFLEPETIGIIPKAVTLRIVRVLQRPIMCRTWPSIWKKCPEEIEVNPGGRQIGKSVITSFWGKLGQRENQAKTSIVNDIDEFFDIPSRPFLEVNNIYPVNDETLIVNWQYKYESYQILPSVSVTLAAYTTAQARLRLHYFLEQLGDRVLYFDTDSIAYISRPGAYDVPLGSCLGDLTDELEEYGPNSYISHFASGGPKLYGYRVQSTNYHKHLDIIKVKEYVTTKNILRTPDHSVVTRAVTKIFRPNFSKRKRIDNYDSVPYGYKILKTKE
nr:unnamed protein product [Callosobruchus analis]